MKPLIPLLAAATLLTLAVRHQFVNGGVESRESGTGHSVPSETRIGIGTVATLPATSWPSASGSSDPPVHAQSIEDQLVTEVGLSPDYASNVVAHINALAAPHRTNRGLWPGASTNVLWVSNRFVMFPNGSSLGFEP